MNIILLSGGSGIRLWPLSNETRSKQFLQLLPDGKGGMQSMVQRVFGQIKEELGDDASITIATSESQVESITTQMGLGVDIITEPERRDTYPAILLACAYLYYEKGANRDEPVIVAPVDPYTENSFFGAFSELADAVKSGEYNLGLLGIIPTMATSKYGYILPAENSGEAGMVAVNGFSEKPDVDAAFKLIGKGALWNGGVFAFKLGYVIDKLEEQTDERSFEGVRREYNVLTKISFDYAVVEKERMIGVLPYYGDWKDLGTWNTFTEQMGESVIGNVVVDETCENTHVLNMLNTPIVAMGINDIVIAASYDGILVTDKDRSGYMKPYVEKVLQRPMYERKRWGTYRVLDYVSYDDGSKVLTKRLTLNEGKNISYQSHSFREEIWTITCGEGEIILEDECRKVKVGDVVNIPLGAKHGIKAITDLEIIEVQLGTELEDSDVIRIAMEW
jgi:mannose-1-phosphate guanylyltransferase